MCYPRRGGRKTQLRDQAGIARWYESDGVIYEFYDSEGKTPPINLHRKAKDGPDAKIAAEYPGINICDYNWSVSLLVDLLLGK